jgi:FK506-binding protein 1
LEFEHVPSFFYNLSLSLSLVPFMDCLTLFFSGTLASNGQKFDASRDRGRPFSFTIGVGQVIQGWDEGVMQMSLGEKAMLHITSDYGYGARGAGGVIPPNADLNFEVELLNIN